MFRLVRNPHLRKRRDRTLQSLDVDISNVIIDSDNIVVKANSESDDGNHPAMNVHYQKF